jgi:uncharacterized protein
VRSHKRAWRSGVSRVCWARCLRLSGATSGSSGQHQGDAKPADAEALRVVLAVADRSAVLTDELLEGDAEAVIARCENVVVVAVRTERALRTIGVRLDADRHRVEASAAGRDGAAVLDFLIERDRLSVRDGAEQLSASPTTIGAVLERLVQLGIAEAITGKRRGRWFRYAALRQAMSDVLQPVTAAVTVHNGAVHNEDAAIPARPVREWVPVVVERVFQGSDAQRVVLFGSVARGDERADSDIDLLVVLPHVTRAHDDAVRIMRLLRDIPRGFGVIVTDDDRLALQSKVPGVIRVALREGRTFERAA